MKEKSIITIRKELDIERLIDKIDRILVESHLTNIETLGVIELLKAQVLDSMYVEEEDEI